MEICKHILKHTYLWDFPNKDFSITFDKHNGFCILIFLNWFVDTYGVNSLHSIAQIENLIENLPRHYNSHKEAAAWICKNWNSDIYTDYKQWRSF